MKTTVTCHCPMCGRITYVAVEESAYYDYVYGNKLAQEAFADLSIETRESIISGMCGECQERKVSSL